MPGKVKKAKASQRHQPLVEQILEGGAPRVKAERSKRKKVEISQEEGEYVGSGLSRKILEQARQQQEELEEEFGVRGSRGSKITKKASIRDKRASDDRKNESEDDSEGELEEEKEGGEPSDYCPVVSEEDVKAMERFMSREEQPRQTLATLIQEKIRDKETEISARMTEAASGVPVTQMDEKVVSVFQGVAKILTKYRSGKLPKAFKVIPSLSNWEEVLHMTEPENWSAAAMFQATRIFASNLNSSKAQRFYNLVLLPRIRDDISEYKRLNFHLYMALKKSLFKPAAFFKGLLLPLCESGTCTLREALIVASVLAKNSVPMLHSSAALLRIAEMDYTGANSIFIRTLLDKKYALPYRVVDAIVFHFARFMTDDRDMPVLWHQSLLTFVQRYKEDLAVEQKESLLELIRSKDHDEIALEVRREIVNSKCRDLGTSFNDRNAMV
jgi:essential nuclear protein 1